MGWYERGWGVRRDILVDETVIHAGIYREVKVVM